MSTIRDTMQRRPALAWAAAGTWVVATYLLTASGTASGWGPTGWLAFFSLQGLAWVGFWWYWASGNAGDEAGADVDAR